MLRGRGLLGACVGRDNLCFSWLVVWLRWVHRLLGGSRSVMALQLLCRGMWGTGRLGFLLLSQEGRLRLRLLLLVGMPPRRWSGGGVCGMAQGTRGWGCEAEAWVGTGGVHPGAARASGGGGVVLRVGKVQVRHFSRADCTFLVWEPWTRGRGSGPWNWEGLVRVAGWRCCWFCWWWRVAAGCGMDCG